MPQARDSCNVPQMFRSHLKHGKMKIDLKIFHSNMKFFSELLKSFHMRCVFYFQIVLPHLMWAVSTLKHLSMFVLMISCEICKPPLWTLYQFLATVTEPPSKINVYFSTPRINCVLFSFKEEDRSISEKCRLNRTHAPSGSEWGQALSKKIALQYFMHQAFGPGEN